MSGDAACDRYPNPNYPLPPLGGPDELSEQPLDQWFNPNDITDSVTSPGKCESGIATVLTFDFPSGVTLPDQVIWTVAFDTTHYGPIAGWHRRRLLQLPRLVAPTIFLTLGQRPTPDRPMPEAALTRMGLSSMLSPADFYCDGGAGGTNFLRLDTLLPPGECWTGFTPLGEVITH